jgi:hypothetical protein
MATSVRRSLRIFIRWGIRERLEKQQCIPVTIRTRCHSSIEQCDCRNGFSLEPIPTSLAAICGDRSRWPNSFCRRLQTPRTPDLLDLWVPPVDLGTSSSFSASKA